MVGDVEVAMDMVADIGMIMLVVITLVLRMKWIITMEDKEPKWLAKVIMMQVEIVVLNMVLDLAMEHIIIDYLGHWHCFLFLWTCQKGKGNDKRDCQPHPNFCGRNRSVYVMSKWLVKESKHSYGG
jgi:hypothetical protein